MGEGCLEDSFSIALRAFFGAAIPGEGLVSALMCERLDKPARYL